MLTYRTEVKEVSLVAGRLALDDQKLKRPFSPDKLKPENVVAVFAT